MMLMVTCDAHGHVGSHVQKLRGTLSLLISDVVTSVPFLQSSAKNECWSRVSGEQ